MLRELKEEGIDYVPLDLKRSTEHWEVTEADGKRVLLGPLTMIKGLGSASVREIIGARESGLVVRPALQKRLDRAKTEIDTLYPVRDSARKNYPEFASEVSDKDDKLIRTLKRDIENIQAGDPGFVYCIGVLKRLTVKDENDEQSVLRRGGKVKTGKTKWLGMFIEDDTGEIFCKIAPYVFELLAQPIIDRGQVGKAIYMIKGTVPGNFRMITVDTINYLGMLEE
jgi:hypothetical protein